MNRGTEYLIEVSYDKKHKMYQARCKELPGMFVDCETLEEIFDVVPWAVNSIVNDQQETVDITPLYMIDKSFENRVH